MAKNTIFRICSMHMHCEVMHYNNKLFSSMITLRGAFTDSAVAKHFQIEASLKSVVLINSLLYIRDKENYRQKLKLLKEGACQHVS